MKIKSIKIPLIHLCVSFIFSLVAASVIFLFWFPRPDYDLSGGAKLFGLIVFVDGICGPLITLFVFNSNKSKKELFFDFSTVLLLQISALIYGVYSIAAARPVVLAFEVDRFVVVSASEVDSSTLMKALPIFQNLSWSGPKLVGVREPKDNLEMLKSLDLSTQGLAPSARPDWWIDYEKSRPSVLKRMESIKNIDPYLNNINIIQAAKNLDYSKAEINYLPLVSSKKLDSWIILLNDRADIIGYAPVSGFK